MAEQVTAFPIRTRASKYPWAEWLDGSIWRLEKEKDFANEAKAFRTIAFSSARRMECKLRTSIKEEGGKEVIYLQAYKPTETESNGNAKRQATKRGRSK